MKKFISFVGQEAMNLSVGYFAGLMASNLVSQFFVRRGLGNLWGLTTKRSALNKDDYDWVMFFTSYAIGLIVMVLVQFGMRKLRGQKVVQVEG